ncbi:reverse transcriptase [Operophtera brumata]|uniref:Reverse transcriptase n=1 Tax=Operophtera brumata TaxID=104452 RepID=A0A0L7L676_OPEBR|nr:reverse transcriptase [Operophtera brumata]
MWLGVRRLCHTNDVIALQETWLLPHDLVYLGGIDENFAFTATSAMDTSAGVLRDRAGIYQLSTQISIYIKHSMEAVIL